MFFNKYTLKSQTIHLNLYFLLHTFLMSSYYFIYLYYIYLYILYILFIYIYDLNKLGNLMFLFLEYIITDNI